MSEPDLDAGCSPSPWPGVEAVELHWQEYQCLVPGGYVIYQLRHFGQRTSPLGASSGRLTGGAVGRITFISISGVLSAAKTKGIFQGNV